MPDRLWIIKDKRTGFPASTTLYSKEEFENTMNHLLSVGFKKEDLEVLELPCEDASGS